MSAALLLIGNELLGGKIQEANLQPLARMLRGRGIELVRAVTVPDRLEVIADEVSALAASHEWLFTSGGVGPTHDDVTLASVAAAFGRPVVRHPEFEARVRAQYGARLQDAHLRMADVPEGAELVTGNPPTWPVVRVENVWIMPGVPEVFRMKLALVQDVLPQRAGFHTTSVFTNLDEGQLAPLLEEVVAAYPDVEVGSYPKWFDPSYKTKLTFDGQNGARVAAAAERFLRLLPAGEPQKVETEGPKADVAAPPRA